MASKYKFQSDVERDKGRLRVPALVMAGGRGSRMGLSVEKPLLSLLGKPLIDWVVDAVKSAERVSDLYVVTSQNTPETEKKCLGDALKVIRTNAKGYHGDLKEALAKTEILSPVLIVSSDVPALTGEFIDIVVKKFEENGVDALTVLVPVEKRVKMGLSVSSTYPFEGKSYCVCGVNVINAAKIGEETLAEQAFITEEVEAVLNVNTLQDLEITERLMRKLRE
jgi:adenosylcobinamide-phosphate guanylyltransferase